MLEGFAAMYVAALKEEPPLLAARDALTAWVRDLLQSRRTFMVEIPLAFFALGMGAWLLHPGWNSLARPGAFIIVRELPEVFWGLLLVGNGLHYCAGLLAASLRQPWAVRHCLIACTLSSVIWGTFFFDLLLNSAPTLGAPLFALPWCLSIGCQWRLIVVTRGQKAKQAGGG